MRLGVLDVGSNAAQLQVVDALAGAPPLPLRGVKIPTRLGQEATADGAIGQRGLDRIVAAVRTAVDAARALHVDQLYPFVTAAIRDADNREEVLEAVAAETGTRLRFLTGEQEAKLTYFAVRSWYGWQAGRLLNIDIGGGSMELAFGRDAVPELAVSLPLGAGRVQWEGTPRRVIATSKTFKQLARFGGAACGRKGPFIRRTVTIEQIRRSIRDMMAVDVQDRAQFRGIRPARAWQVLGGAVVAFETMRCLGIDEAEVSPWALREGIMLEYLSSMRAPESDLALQLLRFDGAKELATVTALPRMS
ncbi:Ppx/GppA family phosphatase [Mycolicibacterium neworleansense]|nr:hypothetical protein [Mycolicibacterium neworleansense]MCV7365824.1 hypothetical protein [Mycolicibacterium neworleansense]